MKRGYAGNDADSHEAHRNNAPAHTPAAGRTAVPLSKNASIRAVDLAENKIIALAVVSINGDGKLETSYSQYPTHYIVKTWCL
jgi:hypothetical protein